ncbi:MAG: STELLO glycosyltransferase family protein [Phycisphaerales bacterium]
MPRTEQIALVVTSIAADSHPILRELSRGAGEAGWRFLVIGDTKSPAKFSLGGCEFMGVDDQLAWGQKLNLRYARACPTRHYARKNVGYLEAIRGGAKVIVETDDDNIPLGIGHRALGIGKDGGVGNGERGTGSGEEFFYGVRDAAKRVRVVTSSPVTDSKGNVAQGWVNVYRYFTKNGNERGEPAIWPRGLALDWIHRGVPELAGAAVRDVTCPIQQGLANENPDVDAVYRLCRALPFSFEDSESVGLGNGAWCPFNSQNTTWFPAAFPMLYLPALCSFRMTDIWRSFVAQRVCWANGWPILFHRATVRQERNDHNLMRDFEDEISGYLQNSKIAETLAALDLAPGEQHVAANVRRCYHALVTRGLLPVEEMALLDAWLHDLSMVRGGGVGVGGAGVGGDAGASIEVKASTQVKA